MKEKEKLTCCCEEQKKHYDYEDTKYLMFSSDYKERFIAEYIQLKVRYNKLNKLVNKWIGLIEVTTDHEDFCNRLGFKPSCSLGILQEQKYAMKTYLDILMQRAAMENIELPEE